MTVSFVLATRTKVDAFIDNASIGDVVNYQIDCTPWQDDNSVITSVEWENYGSSNAGIGTPTLVSGVTSCLITFNEAGWARIKIVLTTATQKKTIWLKTHVVDRTKENGGDDYGHGN
jgi:hypothetical protein